MDRLRQVFVTASEVFCVIGTLYGVGVLGTRVEESSGGALAADATLLAPAVTAFSIWSVIYVGLAGYTIWQWLPGQTTDQRQRAIGWLAGISMILNAGWLLVTQQGWLWASVGVILALALTLGELMRRLTVYPKSGLAEAVLVNGTFGLYLGWVAVATCANITATLVASGVDPEPPLSIAAAVAVLAVAAGLAWLFRARLGPQLAVGLAMAWGLGWIAVGRATDAPQSTVTAAVATAAAIAALAAHTLPRSRGAHVSTPSHRATPVS